jgi:phosphoesterase RecJ-like protein
MPLDWKPFVDFVHRHQHFLVTTHVRPDGDALGSQLALSEALTSLGKRVSRVVPGRMPPVYEFLDPQKQIEAFTPPGDHLKQCDAILIVDTGTWTQLPGLADVIKASPAEKFVIDHHQTQDTIGERIVDTTSESCGRLVHEAIKALGVPISESLAQFLFIAVATDAGLRWHANTSPATLNLAVELWNRGARPTDAYERIYQTNSVARLHLRARVLARLTTTAGGRIGYSEVHADDYTATGAIPPDTEDLINYPRTVAGVDLAMMFMEQPDGAIKVSFRSRDPIDVAALAEQFGGGGHKRAAGATLTTPLAQARDKVLAAAVKVLETGEVRK